MNKITRVSLLFRVLFQLGFIILPILLVVAWIIAPTPLSTGDDALGIKLVFIPTSIPILHTLTPLTKLLGFCISMIPNGITMLVLYYLIQLFRLYEKGEIFSNRNVSYIKNIGYSLLIGQLINPIYELLVSATLTWGNGHGQRFATISFSGTNAGILLLALLIILISWIMAEGNKLREEQQLTV